MSMIIITAMNMTTIIITIMQSITMITMTTMMTNIRMRMPEHMRMKSKPGLPAAKPPTAVLLFGLTGGLIPCPAAITVLLICLQLKAFTRGNHGAQFQYRVGTDTGHSRCGNRGGVAPVSRRWQGLGDIAKKHRTFRRR